MQIYFFNDVFTVVVVVLLKVPNIALCEMLQYSNVSRKRMTLLSYTFERDPQQLQSLMEHHEAEAKSRSALLTIFRPSFFFCFLQAGRNGFQRPPRSITSKGLMIPPYALNVIDGCNVIYTENQRKDPEIILTKIRKCHWKSKLTLSRRIDICRSYETSVRQLKDINQEDVRYMGDEEIKRLRFEKTRLVQAHQSVIRSTKGLQVLFKLVPFL